MQDEEASAGMTLTPVLCFKLAAACPTSFVAGIPCPQHAPQAVQINPSRGPGAGPAREEDLCTAHRTAPAGSDSRAGDGGRAVHAATGMLT